MENKQLQKLRCCAALSTVVGMVIGGEYSLNHKQFMR